MKVSLILTGADDDEEDGCASSANLDAALIAAAPGNMHQSLSFELNVV